jgi:pyrroloquinoline quinone (PQQ) biosynthesis protein C
MTKANQITAAKTSKAAGAKNNHAKMPASSKQKNSILLFKKPAAVNSQANSLAAAKGGRHSSTAYQESLAADDFVSDLARQALRHQAVCHPYLEALGKGNLPDLRFALKDFARQYYGYSAHFPRYLTALISKLERPDHRSALLENLTEESGQYEQEELDELAEFGVAAEWIVGIPHPELFQRFRQALGVVNTGAIDDHIEVICWREQFLALLNSGSAAEALGALGLGTETIVQTIYQPFVAAIQQIQMDARDSVFFPLHTAVDDHHQATLKQIAVDFAATAQGRADLTKGMYKALALRNSFWSWLHQRALKADALAA